MIVFGLTHRWGIRQVCSKVRKHTVAPVAARHISATTEGLFDKLIFCARQHRDNELVWPPSKELIKGTCIRSVAKSLEEGKEPMNGAFGFSMKELRSSQEAPAVH